MNRPGRRSWLLAVVVLAGCGDDAATPPTVTAPPELARCVDYADADAEVACLDQIERFIESDVAGVDDAIAEVNDVLSDQNSAAFEFERMTPIGDGADPVTPAESIELWWRVGTSDRTMFVCPNGAGVVVGPDPCSG